MTNAQLKKLVNEAVALHRNIVAQSERLKIMKSDLVREARLHENDFTPTNNGGSRWTATGTDGCIARVNFPAPALMPLINSESETFDKVLTLAGECVDRLFESVYYLRPVAEFREEVSQALPKRDARQLIELCETKCAPLRYKNNVGPQVRRRRYALGWSQSDFAAKLQIAGFDISRSGVSKIEERLSYVDDKALVYLAEVLKVQVQELFPQRTPGNRLYEFMEKLETTRF